MISTSLFIYTESSLHAGVGSTVSVIDLPIQRERTTQFPIVQGSGIKGALRSQVKADSESRDAYINLIFGGEDETENGDGSRKKSSYAGAVSVGDARIVLFPVRSLAGVFVYITCPAVLARVKRDVPSFPELKQAVAMDSALVTGKSAVSASNRVVLEEFSFTAQPNSTVDQIALWLANNALPQTDEYRYWREKLQTSLVILHDDAFRDFVQTSTEVVTRVRLDYAKKTVINGALWTQEALPSDTLLMSAVIVRSTRSQVILNEGQSFSPASVVGWLHDTSVVPSRIQLGGDETTGSGMVALRWHGGQANG
ncbi:MAG: type III-B CRISPR module RAMP protein Cmr4 [bacterium]|nr:type III-B CRISPR module RAMP protein Cmr4 [bacterium]